MQIKNRLSRLEQRQPIQGVETEIKIMPQGVENEFYKFVSGEKIKISEAEYEGIKPGCNIKVKLPEGFKM